MIAFVTVMLVIGGFNVFISVFLMTNGGPLDQTQVLLTYMYRQAFSFLDFGYGSAICVHADADRLRALDRAAAPVPPTEGRPPDGRRQRSAHARDPRARGSLILSAGVVLMVVPFAYMFATSFKPNALVLEIPPKLIPHHADDRELHRRVDARTSSGATS